jgi:hypothetical protein
MLVFTTVQYIAQLDFEYFETYSFNRGPLEARRQELLALEENETNAVLWRELSLKRVALEKQMREKWPRRSAHILNDLNRNLNQNFNLNLNPTAVRTGVFEKNSPQSVQLASILMTEVKNIPAVKGKPEYKDAIIFYNEKKQVISYLEICLECKDMCIEENRRIDADETTYQKCHDFIFDTICHHPTLGLL